MSILKDAMRRVCDSRREVYDRPRGTRRPRYVCARRSRAESQNNISLRFNSARCARSIRRALTILGDVCCVAWHGSHYSAINERSFTTTDGDLMRRAARSAAANWLCIAGNC